MKRLTVAMTLVLFGVMLAHVPGAGAAGRGVEVRQVEGIANFQPDCAGAAVLMIGGEERHGTVCGINSGFAPSGQSQNASGGPHHMSSSFADCFVFGDATVEDNCEFTDDEWACVGDLDCITATGTSTLRSRCGLFVAFALGCISGVELGVTLESHATVTGGSGDYAGAAGSLQYRLRITLDGQLPEVSGLIRLPAQ